MSATRTNGHKWYAVQCLSNHEDKVRRYLSKYKEESEEFSKCLNEVLVPIETVSEVKNGKKETERPKVLPRIRFRRDDAIRFAGQPDEGTMVQG